MNPISEILSRHPSTEGLNEVEWSTRAQGALTSMGITTVAELCNVDGAALQHGRNVGATTLRELLRGCVQLNVVPRWVKEVRIGQLFPVEKCPEDMVPLAGPYALTERWMLELAIAQLGDVAWCVVQEVGGLMLCREREGFIEVGPEE